MKNKKKMQFSPLLGSSHNSQYYMKNENCISITSFSDHFGSVNSINHEGSTKLRLKKI